MKPGSDLPAPRAWACQGLAEGWARRLSNHQPVHASQVARGDGPFYCAECHAEVVLRQGIERAGHFAHEAAGTRSSPRNETALHLACKQEVHAALARENPHGRWEVERRIPANRERNVPEVRPDISGRIRNTPLAIEVQASALGVAEILQRTRVYGRRGIAVLWIVPLCEQLADDGIRPRLHERHLHGMYLGRTYYWWPGRGAAVLPVHYGVATRLVPSSEWFRPGWGHVRSGGYDSAYRSIKTPWCGPWLRISEDFAPCQRGPCHLWLDCLDPWW